MTVILLWDGMGCHNLIILILEGEPVWCVVWVEAAVKQRPRRVWLAMATRVHFGDWRDGRRIRSNSLSVLSASFTRNWVGSWKK